MIIMRSNKNYIGTCFALFILLLTLGSCSKMNDLHDKYLKDGEQVYVGQPDSAKVMSGNKRALIRYWTSDPKAKKILLFWNLKKDSLLLDIPTKSRLEPVDVIVGNLEENNYAFELVTTNSELKNRSIPLPLNIKVYGDLFQASLHNRKVKSSSYSTVTKGLTINWHGAVEKSVAVEMQYVDLNNRSVDTLISPSEKSSILGSFKSGLSYRTIFLPEKGAIDSFYTEKVEVPIVLP